MRTGSTCLIGLLGRIRTCKTTFVGWQFIRLAYEELESAVGFEPT